MLKEPIEKYFKILKCFFTHEWTKFEYIPLSKRCCKQIRVCNKCGKKDEKHIENHAWNNVEYSSKISCKQERSCNHCQEKEEMGEKHVWGDWHYLTENGCVEVKNCKRCHKQIENEEVKHIWGEWHDVFFSNMVRSSCVRCQFEGERESNTTPKCLISGCTNYAVQGTGLCSECNRGNDK